MVCPVEATLNVGAVTLTVNDAFFDKTASGTGFTANFEPSANNT